MFAQFVAAPESADPRYLSMYVLLLVLIVLVVLIVLAVHYFNSDPGNVEKPEDLNRIDKNPRAGVNSKAENIKDQVAYFDAQKAKVQKIHELENTAEEFARKDVIDANAHKVLLAQQEALHQRVAEAKARKLDETSYEAVRLMEEGITIEKQKAQIASEIKLHEAKVLEDQRIVSRQIEINQDVNKAERMATIDVKKEDDLMKLYIWTSKVERMFPKEIQGGLQDKIFGQIDVISKIQNEPLSPERTAKLQVARMLLDSWVRELDELTRGKEETVSGSNGPGTGQLEAPPEPPTSNPEDD